MEGPIKTVHFRWSRSEVGPRGLNEQAAQVNLVMDGRGPHLEKPQFWVTFLCV